jgi:DNA invertase Pin-like site-specific DNA recombinase
MSTAEAPIELITRPKRADARRNYEKVLAAARDAFAAGGEATSLEEIARRAGVGIGTLYRHFRIADASLSRVTASPSCDTRYPPD